MPDILRTGTPMADWRVFEWTVDVSVTKTGTYTYKIEDTIAILHLPSNESISIGEAGVFIYHAERIMIRKKTGSGEIFAIGQKVYVDLTDMLVTPHSPDNGLWIGICVRAAAMNDVRVMIDLKGDKAT